MLLFNQKYVLVCVCVSVFVCVRTWLLPECSTNRRRVSMCLCLYVCVCMCENTTSPWVWHESWMRIRWLVHMCDRTCRCVLLDSFTYVTWLNCINMICDKTDSYMWHDSFTCVTGLVDVSYLTHSRVLHESLVCLFDVWRLAVCAWVCTNFFVAMYFDAKVVGKDSNTLRRTATHCNSLQHTATHCNTLQHTATHSLLQCILTRSSWARPATHCNTPQHTATRYLLQHTLTRSSRAKTATQCNTLQHVVKHCNALQLNILIFQGKAHGKVEKNRFRWRQWEAPTCW